MKTATIILIMMCSYSLNAQERIIHSSALGCYIDLEKIAGITELYNKWNGHSTYGYELRYAPYRDWRFTIIYQFRDDYTHQFYADSAKAYQVYYRIVNKWKRYINPPKPKSNPIILGLHRSIPHSNYNQIIDLLKEDIVWMDSTKPHIMWQDSPDPWSRSIKTSKEIIKLLK